MENMLAIRDNVELSLETISALVSATGTAEQKGMLVDIKDNIKTIYDLQDEDYIEAVQSLMSMLSNDKFNLDFIAVETDRLRLNLSALSTLKLKEVITRARTILQDNNIATEELEEDVARVEETKAEEIKEEIKTKEEKMKTENKTNKETETEKTIRELKEKLEKAKAKADGCKTSTLAKVGKVTLGVAVVGAAFAAGYYGAKHLGSTNTTIILNGGSEE